MTKHLAIFFSVIVGVSWGISDASADDGKIRIYPHKMSADETPDYATRAVRSPNDETFGKRTQFAALRRLGGNAKQASKSLEKWTKNHALGDVVWPNYQDIFSTDIKQTADEIAKRGLYLFDIWGFVPGSGTGAEPWIEFSPPDGVLEHFQNALGQKWLGMDNGEQDGRYVRGFAPSAHKLSDGFSRYLDFHNHFKRLENKLGDKMVALLAYNFGHYFLKEGVYTLIGAESAQALPNTQISYSFIRGAGKQYGVPWFGNVSVFNRWGWKAYPKKIKAGEGTPTDGTSLSLMKRLMYTHFMYGCKIAGFESSFELADGTLSPIGKMQAAAIKWCIDNPDLGTLHTPVAVMFDFFSGWTFPRHTKAPYLKWGGLPFSHGDYMSDAVFDLMYPAYRDCSYFTDERGFVTPTPFGDIADCVLSDASAEMLAQYPMLIVGGDLRPSRELRDTLEKYVSDGGTLIVSSAPLAALNGAIAGATAKSETFSARAPIVFDGGKICETDPYELAELSLPAGSKTTKNSDGQIVFAEVKFGRGTLKIFASPYMISSVQKARADADAQGKANAALPVPFPILKHAAAMLSTELSELNPLKTNPELSLIVCTRGENKFSAAILNNDFSQKKFWIKPARGKISKIREIEIDRSERIEIGYQPKGFTRELGENSDGTIAGGDIRIFEIEIENAPIFELPKIVQKPNPKGRTLSLDSVKNVEEEVLKRPTFARHFDCASIDWRYFDIRTDDAIADEARWIKRRGLKIAVDFSSAINLFPDLRIIDNDKKEYGKSISRILQAIKKAWAFGAQKVYITLQRRPENNYDIANYDADSAKTFRKIADFCAPLKMSVVLVPHFGRDKSIRVWGGVVPNKYNARAREIAKLVGRNNFGYALNAALAVYGNETAAVDAGEFSDAAEISLGAPQTDANGFVFDFNLPMFKSAKNAELGRIVKKLKNLPVLFDAVYESQDDEYEESREYEKLSHY